VYLSIHYRGVVSHEKGSVIIRYELPELMKKVADRSHVSSMTRAGSRILHSRSRVSSMTCECTDPIYYRELLVSKKEV